MIRVTMKSADGSPSSFTGHRAGLNFSNGVAYLDREKGEALNSGQRAFFARKGYEVTGDATATATASRRGGRRNGEE